MIHNRDGPRNGFAHWHCRSAELAGHAAGSAVVLDDTVGTGVLGLGHIDNFDISYSGIGPNNTLTSGGLIPGAEDFDTQFVIRYTYIGDVNLDGKVTTWDYDFAFGNLGATTNDVTASPVIWGDGDFNGNGVVDTTDVDTLFANLGLGQPGNSNIDSNFAPSLFSIPNQAVHVGGTLAASLFATDDIVTLIPAPLNYSLTLPASLPVVSGSMPTLSANGDLVWTPAASQAGTWTLTARATDIDADPMYDEKTFQVTVKVNQAPVFAPLPSFGNVTIPAIDPTTGLANTLPQGNHTIVPSSGGNSSGGSSGSSGSGSGGGSGSGSSGSGSGGTVNPDDPFGAGDQLQYVEVGVPIEFQLNATDPDGDPVSFWLDAGAPDNAYVSPNGEFVWVPTSSQIGFVGFSIYAGSGGKSLSATFPDLPGSPSPISGPDVLKISARVVGAPTVNGDQFALTSSDSPNDIRQLVGIDPNPDAEFVFGKSDGPGFVDVQPDGKVKIDKASMPASENKTYAVHGFIEDKFGLKTPWVCYALIGTGPGIEYEDGLGNTSFAAYQPVAPDFSMFVDAYEDPVGIDTEKIIQKSYSLTNQVIPFDTTQMKILVPPTLGDILFDENGGWTYKPHTGAYGMDKFTYKIVGTPEFGLDSNVGTVEIAVGDDWGITAEYRGFKPDDSALAPKPWSLVRAILTGDGHAPDNVFDAGVDAFQDYYAKWWQELKDVAKGVNNTADQFAAQVKREGEDIFAAAREWLKTHKEGGVTPSSSFGTSWGVTGKIYAPSPFSTATYDIGGHFEVDPAKGETTAGAHGTVSYLTPPIPYLLFASGAVGAKFSLEATSEAPEHEWHGDVTLSGNGGISWGIFDKEIEAPRAGKPRLETKIEGGASVKLVGDLDWDLNTGTLSGSLKIVAECHLEFIVGSFKKEYSADYTVPLIAVADVLN